MKLVSNLNVRDLPPELRPVARRCTTLRLLVDRISASADKLRTEIEARRERLIELDVRTRERSLKGIIHLEDKLKELQKFEIQQQDLLKATYSKIMVWRQNELLSRLPEQFRDEGLILLQERFDLGWRRSRIDPADADALEALEQMDHKSIERIKDLMRRAHPGASD